MAELKDKKNNFYNFKSTGIGKASVKDVDLTKRIVTGFFNTYNFLDSQGDVLMPGCAKKTINNSGPDSDATAKIKHCLFHDLTKFPGKLQILVEKEIDGVPGIYFETRCSNTTEGNDTLINYQEGIYDNHSIGFRYVDAKWVERDAHGNSKQWDTLIGQLLNPDAAAELGAIYVVKEIEMFEGSTVGFGANSLTPYLGAKGQNKDSLIFALFSKIDRLNYALAGGTQSDGQMKTFELQILQIKQNINDVFAMDFSKKNTMGYEDAIVCVNCGETAMENEDGSCPKCNQQMKSLIIPATDAMALMAKAFGG